MPGDRHGPGGAGPLGPQALPESVLQRIRAALDGAEGEASPQEHAASAGQPPSLPRRVPGASNGPEPPAVIARPKLPASLLRSRSGRAPAEPPPAVPAPRSSGATEKIGVQPDSAAQPEPTTAAPADAQPVPAQRPPAEQRPDRQDRRDEEAASPGKVPAHQEDSQASPRKARPRRTTALGRRVKALARPPKPALPKAPGPPPEPAPPKAPGPPPDSASPKALAPPPEPSGPQRRARRSRGVTRGVALTLVLLSAGSAAFLLVRHTGTTRVGTRPSGEVAVRNR